MKEATPTAVGGWGCPFGGRPAAVPNSSRGASAPKRTSRSVDAAASSLFSWSRSRRRHRLGRVGAGPRGQPTQDREGPSNPRRVRRRRPIGQIGTCGRVRRGGLGRLRTSRPQARNGLTGGVLSLGNHRPVLVVGREQDGLGMTTADEGFVDESALLVPDVQQVAVVAVGQLGITLDARTAARRKQLGRPSRGGVGETGTPLRCRSPGAERGPPCLSARYDRRRALRWCRRR